ncbi:MAG: dTDP-4-dehydrorhamnose 3,5-epimerase [Chitinophagaceae bacterium]|nr:dTDP-4-dehydrorhamnose 3,5-epimerase [Chitinophagaceae bacterium]
MAIIKTDFPGLFVFEPAVFEDSRGYFFESYNERVFEAAGIATHFVQDNQARSAYGVIRGLHYQMPPHAQSKLIRVLEGSILDIVVDIRKGSPRFGQSFSIELSSDNKKQLFIPKGFAHGYSVISETAEVFYKCDEFYHPETEGGIRIDDPGLKIDWMIPEEQRIVSEKDRQYPFLPHCKNPFVFEQ